MRANGVGYADTSREPYNRIVGYRFGEWMYNGAYWDEHTGIKQYEFYKHDGDKITESYLTDYKGFREIIDKYDWPRK